MGLRSERSELLGNGIRVGMSALAGGGGCGRDTGACVERFGSGWEGMAGSEDSEALEGLVLNEGVVLC